MRRRDFIAGFAGAAGLPFMASAQQAGRERRVSVLMQFAESDKEGQLRARAFQEGLEGRGWSIGPNLLIDFRWGVGNAEWARSTVSDMMKFVPEVVLANGDQAARAAQSISRTMPIVFIGSSDPVAEGFVQSLAHPGANMTGISTVEPSLGPKWLQLLKEIAPQVTRVAVLFNPGNSGSVLLARAAADGAKKFASEVVAAPVVTAEEVRAAADMIARTPNGGLVVPPDPIIAGHRKLIVELADRYRLPAVYALRSFVAEGGLISYGISIPELFRQAAGYVDRILRGDKPEDLPVQGPTNFEMQINLKTARGLGDRGTFNAAGASRRVNRVKRRAFIAGLGATAVRPLALRAQQPAKAYRVVFVSPSTPLDRIETDDPTYAAFLGELRRLGYVAGENLVMERRSAEGRPERYADIAREVAGLKPDAVVVSSSKFAVAFKEAAGGVPVVALAFDPVGSGLAASIAHPGGNVTGFSGGTSVEIIAKQFEILKAIDTAITRIGFVTDASPDSTWAALQFTLRGLAGLRYGVTVLGQPVASPAREPEYRKLIEGLLDQGASALIIDATAANLANASMIAALANANRLPSISADVEQARGGCLAACAPDLGDSFRQMAGYVDRILRGEKAGELAFMQPTTFRLTINRKTAKALGLQLAPELVALASEVID